MKNFLASLLFLCASVAGMAQATQLQGTLNNPDGSGFNGLLTMSLAQQASISSANGCGGPVMVPSTVTISITFKNGAMVNAPKIYGSDCTLPYGVPYNVTARDSNGNVDFTAQWLPLGSIQDIGTIQSVVNPLGTLFGLSLSDIALTDAQNIFTQNNTFQQNVSIAGNLVVTGTISSILNNPVIVQGNGNSIDFEVKNTAGTDVFQVDDSGIVTVTLNYLNVAGIVDSNVGFVVNGNGGISGQCLVSNGKAFIPGTCTSTGGGTAPAFYQTDYSALSAAYLPQRGINGFQSRFQLTDNPGGGDTIIDLANTGVTPGTYTYPSAIAVDTWGRITSIASGSLNTQKLAAVTVTNVSCTTSSNPYTNCPVSVIWPNGGFADANYTPVCTAGSPTNVGLTGIWISNISAGGITVNFQNGSANGGVPLSLQTIYCMALHP